MGKPFKLHLHDDTSPKEGSWTTSVNLETKHRDFIKRRGLNLSAQVRELLDYLMAREGPTKPDEDT